jgi:hypothetical protein
MTVARGVGIVTPPANVRVTRARRVRRSDGYIARNGAWIATAEASYLELSRDLRDLDRKRDRAIKRADRSIAKAEGTFNPNPKRLTTAEREAWKQELRVACGMVGDQNH